MGRREFAVRDIVELYLHWQAGESVRAVARNLGLDRNTVRKYIRAALEAGFAPGRVWSEGEWAAFVQKALPEATDPLARCPAFLEIDRFREEIREAVGTNTVTTVWQRLRDEAGLKASLSSFRRYLRAMMPEVLNRLEVTVWRPEVSPGEEAQVDFGYLGTWVDPAKGVTRRVWAFVMVLAYSRHMFVWPVLKLDLIAWLECHLRAFAFFGGVPRRLALDNLKDGVVKPDTYDPQFNRAYGELASHYHTLIDPCRKGHPKDKPRVERVIPYVRDSYWRGRQFSSLAEASREALRWCLEVAGRRIHGTTRQKPLELFEQEEKSRLLPLPPEPWELATWQKAKVAPDCYASVARSLYSLPFKYVGRTLEVRISQRTVEFYLGEELVKTHPRVPAGRRRTDPADLPPDKIAFYERTPQWCLEKAKELGPSVHQAVLQLLAVNTFYNLRQAQGLLRLGERYGPTRLNAAASRALAYGDPGYRTVKNILERGLDRLPPDTGGAAEHLSAFLHGKEQFALKEG